MLSWASLSAWKISSLHSHANTPHSIEHLHIMLPWKVNQNMRHQVRIWEEGGRGVLMHPQASELHSVIALVLIAIYAMQKYIIVLSLLKVQWVQPFLFNHQLCAIRPLLYSVPCTFQSFCAKLPSLPPFKFS